MRSETSWDGASTGRRIVSMARLQSTNEFKVAGQRMRHLAPWNVKPVPAMHFAVARVSTPRVSITSQQRERCERLAYKVLAVHMHEAVAKSALR